MVGGGRGRDDVVFHVMVRVPSPTPVHKKVVLSPKALVVLVGDVVKAGVVAMGMNGK